MVASKVMENTRSYTKSYKFLFERNNYVAKLLSEQYTYSEILEHLLNEFHISISYRSFQYFINKNQLSKNYPVPYEQVHEAIVTISNDHPGIKFGKN